MGDWGLRDVLIAHRAALVRFLRARGAGEEAEDLFQDLWIRLGAAASGPVGDPLAYLYRMADNLMIDRHRARIRRERREDGWSKSIGPAKADISEEPSPERRLIAGEQLDATRARLASLGQRTERIFLRFRLDGMAQRAIAAELGVSISAVEKHLQKAYRALLSVEANADQTTPHRLDREGALDDEG